jgi:iron complex transport system substrate-binding protein
MRSRLRKIPLRIMVLALIATSLALFLPYSQSSGAETPNEDKQSTLPFSLPAKEPTNNGKPMIRVLDAWGREVTVPKDPRRIVVLTAYTMEMIRILGEVDRVVGTTNFIKVRVEYIPELVRIPDVGSSSIPNLEAVARLKPDLVIAWRDVPGPSLEETLGSLGISVLRLHLSDQVNFNRDVMTLAEILGEEAKIKARKFITWNDNLEKRLKNTLAAHKGKKPSVLVEHYNNRSIAGPPSACFATTVMAGGDNLGKNISQIFSEMDEEWVIKQNPDFYAKLGIFFSLEQKNNSKKISEALKDEIMERSGWDSMTAVKEGGVFVLDEDLCGGPRGMVGAYAASARFYEGLVNTDEALNIKREYVEKFQNLPYEP